MSNIWCALLTITVSCCVLQQVTTQFLDVPHIACPQYFEYLCYGNVCIGKITLHSVQLGETNVNVEFSQRYPVQQNNYGSLTLFEDKDTTVEKIKNGEPISYRVDFPLSNVLPKLTKLYVNGALICQASAYPPPSTTITQQHTLTASVYTTYTSVPYTIYNDRIIPGQPEYHFTTHLQQPRRPQQRQRQQSYLRNKQRQNQRTPSRSQPSRDFYSNTSPREQQQTKFNQQREPYPQSSVDQFGHNIFLQPRESIAQIAIPRMQQQQPTFIQPTEVNRRLLEPSIFESIERNAPTPVQPVQQPTFIQSRDPLSQGNNQFSCGREGSTSGIVPFISGGTILRPGQFPWLTAIYHKSVTGTSFLCGGSLISARTILSAAHCFQLTQLTADKIMVTLGRYNLSNSMEATVVTRDVKTLLINPEYDPNMFPDADVALLLMSAPVSFTSFISPICLWGGPEDTNLVVNETGYVAGWGGDEDGNEISAVPKMAPANIVSETVCRQSSELFKILTTSRTLCAGQQNGVGPCMGDSGGGLMIQRNGVWQLRGVVSAGHSEKQHCNLRKYVVYCDVAKFSHWVHSHML